MCTPISGGYTLEHKCCLHFSADFPSVVVFNTRRDIIQASHRLLRRIVVSPIRMSKARVSAWSSCYTVRLIPERGVQRRIPFWMMSAGDLGLDARQRSVHETECIELISIFLRVLECLNGYTIPTTNIIQVSRHPMWLSAVASRSVCSAMKSLVNLNAPSG